MGFKPVMLNMSALKILKLTFSLINHEPSCKIVLNLSARRRPHALVYRS